MQPVRGEHQSSEISGTDGERVHSEEAVTVRTKRSRQATLRVGVVLGQPVDVAVGVHTVDARVADPRAVDVRPVRVGEDRYQCRTGVPPPVRIVGKGHNRSLSRFDAGHQIARPARPGGHGLQRPESCERSRSPVSMAAHPIGNSDKVRRGERGVLLRVAVMDSGHDTMRPDHQIDLIPVVQREVGHVGDGDTATPPRIHRPVLVRRRCRARRALRPARASQLIAEPARAGTVETMEMTLGMRVAKARRDAGLTQGDVADILDIYLSDVERMERGELQPSGFQLGLLTEAMNCSWRELLGLDPRTTNLSVKVACPLGPDGRPDTSRQSQ